MQDFQFYAAIAVFIGTYGLIMAEKIPRSYVSLVGGLIMVLAGFVTQKEAVSRFIDFNTIGLLVGMMIMITIIRQSGIFEATAVWAAKITKGKPKTLLVVLAIITAVASSVFDSVTAVLLLAPMTISLSKRLRIKPYPFLIMEILISNIGGTALMVGNPPNVMIGSATGLSFNEFFLNLAPGVLLTMIVIVPLLLLIYRKDLEGNASAQELAKLNVRKEIRNMKLLKKSLIILGLTILGFVSHSALGLESATIAMTGAVALLILSKTRPVEAFEYVEWDTLFFFIGLFVLVGGIEAAGVIEFLAKEALQFTQGNLEATTFLVLWLAAIVSAFVDNIPFTATMIPLIQEVQHLMGVHVDYLWWSLAMGACYGGNGTIIGASPNLIIAAIVSKEGYNLTFMNYFKVGFPLMLLSVLVSHFYLYVRYFLLG